MFFSKRHGNANRCMFNGGLDAPAEETVTLANLHKLLSKESFILSYAYNADENGLYWHLLPEYIQALKHGKSTPCRKINQQNNFGATVVLMPVTVDNSHHPRAGKDIMYELLVPYFHSKRASSQCYYFMIGFYTICAFCQKTSD
jgi:hypothetical protein